MNISINPVPTSNTLYYLALYAMVFIVRYYKLKKDETGVGWSKHKFKQVFCVGLDLLYTASGLVILLLADLKEYVPAILITYVILLLVSAFTDSMEEKFEPNKVFGINLIIFIVILSTTILYFQTKGHSSDVVRYKVAIPYQDLALRQYFGTAINDKKLVYITTIEAKNEAQAVSLAKQKMIDEVKPFVVKSRQSSQNDIIPSFDEVLVSRIQTE
jgi:hypothetical protein